MPDSSADFSTFPSQSLAVQVGTTARSSHALLFTQMPYAEVRRLREDAYESLISDPAAAHQLFMLEHPPTIVSGPESVQIFDKALLAKNAIDFVADDVERGWQYLGPGQLVIYLIVALNGSNPDRFVESIEDAVLATLADFGVSGARQANGRAIKVEDAAVSALRTRIRRGIAECRLTIHTNTDASYVQTIGTGSGDASRIATLSQLGVPVQQQDEVRASFLKHYEACTGSALHLPQREELKTTKPPWLKAKLPFAPGTERVHGIIGAQRLHTVCESAHCPNMGECWAQGTATFMINGNVCTRSCSFCAVFTGRPLPLDPDEPRRVAEAARQMRLSYVVVTAVNRDERADGGAEQFAATIRALRRTLPGVAVEVLIPDFKGKTDALEIVFRERPEVLNHNIETVPRLYKSVRPQAKYERSLQVIQAAKCAGLTTKSGLMLGLGEEPAEIELTLRDLRQHDCDIVTIGQYLRPSEKHHPVVRYVTPSEFAKWRKFGESLAFRRVESGPLVRSSYHAGESFEHQPTREDSSLIHQAT